MPVSVVEHFFHSMSKPNNKSHWATIMFHDDPWSYANGNHLGGSIGNVLPALFNKIAVIITHLTFVAALHLVLVES